MSKTDLLDTKLDLYLEHAKEATIVLTISLSNRDHKRPSSPVGIHQTPVPGAQTRVSSYSQSVRTLGKTAV